MEYFVDTNFLIHYYFSDRLKWSDITADDTIILHISKVVRLEIDKHKYDGNNQNRAKKARKANQIFDKMLQSKDSSYVQNINGVNVILKFSGNYTSEDLRSYSQGLDLSIPDDVILASLRKYIVEEEKKNCCFLSNDVGALLSAKECNIPFTRIPDTWLPPVPEDKEKEELKRLLKAYEEIEPQIETGFVFNDEEIINAQSNIILSVFKLPEENEVNTISDLYFAQCMSREDTEDNFISAKVQNALNPLYRYSPPSETELSLYKDQYEEWKRSFCKYLDDYIARKNTYHNFVTFTFSLSNIGHISLENALVEFEVLRGGYLVDLSQDTVESFYNEFEPPTQPDPPKGRMIPLSALGNMESLLKNLITPSTKSTIIPPTLFKVPPVDKYSFRTRDCPDGKSKYWSFICDEFRHQREKEHFKGHFYLDLGDDEKIVVKVTISGTNMRNPIINTYTLTITKNFIPYYNDMLSLLGINQETT
jgi:hypothetical protein